MNYKPRAQAKSEFEKDFFKLMNYENIEASNLSQQKGEEIIWWLNQITKQQSFSQNIFQQLK